MAAPTHAWGGRLRPLALAILGVLPNGTLNQVAVQLLGSQVPAATADIPWLLCGSSHGRCGRSNRKATFEGRGIDRLTGWIDSTGPDRCGRVFGVDHRGRCARAGHAASEALRHRDGANHPAITGLRAAASDHGRGGVTDRAQRILRNDLSSRSAEYGAATGVDFRLGRADGRV